MSRGKIGRVAIVLWFPYLVPTLVALVLVRLGPAGKPWTIELLLPLLGIAGLFGLGGCVTFYFLHPRVIEKTGECDGGESDAIHPSA